MSSVSPVYPMSCDISHFPLKLRPTRSQLTLDSRKVWTIVGISTFWNPAWFGKGNEVMSRNSTGSIFPGSREFGLPGRRPTLAKAIGLCSLVALGISGAAVPGYSQGPQVPVANNYLALFLDKKDNKFINVNGMDKNTSSILFGSFDGKPVRIQLDASGVKLAELPTAGEPNYSGGTVPISSGSAYGGGGTLIYGNIYRNDGFANNEALQAWQLDAAGTSYTQAHLNVLTASLFALHPQQTVTAAYGTDGVSIAGLAGPRTVNGQTNYNSFRAMVWRKEASGFTVTNLHQIAGLPDTVYSSANAVLNDSVVGWANGVANLWQRNPSTGSYTVANLHPQAATLLGTPGGSSAAAISADAIVGSGNGANTGVSTFPNQTVTWQNYHALRWQNGGANAAIDLHQSSNLGGYLGAQGWSFATSSRNNVSAGYASSANFGLSGDFYSGYYARHAILWNTGTGGATSFVDLHTFLPPNSPGGSRSPMSVVNEIATDGTIAGRASNLPQFPPVAPATIGPSVTVLWKPLVPGVTGSFNVTVPTGTTGYIVKPFSQTEGTFSVHGTLSPPGVGIYQIRTFTLDGGELNGDGVIDGWLVQNAGTVRVKFPEGRLAYIITSPTLAVSRYYQAPSGVLSVNVTGSGRFLSSGLMAGKLEAENVAEVYGRVQVNVPSSVRPTIGQTLTILTTNSLSGTMTSATPGWQVNHNYTATPKTITITYVGP
jgi:hypothetical protein